MAIGGRALILGDVEGVVGVDDWRDIMAGSAGYPAACRAYAADVTAAVRGLRAGGAAEVLVVDTHAAGLNLVDQRLVGCELIQDPSILVRIERAFAADVAAVVLIGFHAAAGTPDGFVPHSFGVQTRSWLDGRLIGEPGFYALEAGHRGVPTLLVTGDTQTIDQLHPFAPGARGVQTKAAISPWRAASFEPLATRDAIESACADAYRSRGEIAPAVLAEPMTLTVEAQTEVGARLIQGMPGMTEADGRAATFRGAWPEVWRAFVTANSLAMLVATAGGSWYHGPVPGSLVERLAAAAGTAAAPSQRAFSAALFSPPWGEACPPEAMP